jgi:SnoaL-like domain
MSEENVEAARKALEAFDPDLDRLAEFWDPEIDWRAIEGAPMTSVSSRATMCRYYAQWFETFDNMKVEIEASTPARRIGTWVCSGEGTSGRFRSPGAQSSKMR